MVSFSRLLDRRAALAVVVGLSLLVPVKAPPAVAQVTAQAVPGPIDRNNRAEVVSAYKTWLKPALDTPAAWTGGDLASCTPGTETAESRAATMSAVNYYRAMAGLPSVVNEASWNAPAQAAALMMHKAGKVGYHFGDPHEPEPDAPCYSEAARDGASHSNLAWRVAGAEAVAGYMLDSGGNNTAVGHRRWLLYPPSTRMGTGSTPLANAIYHLEDSGYGARPTAPDWIAWPPSGFVPWESLPHADAAKTLFRWSLSSNAMPDADYGQASVSMRFGSEELEVLPEWVSNGAGDNTLVWNAVRKNGNRFPIEGDAVFHVTVSGIQNNGVAIDPYSYTVNAVRAIPDTTAPPAPQHPRMTGGLGTMEMLWPYSPYDPQLEDLKGTEVRIIKGGTPPSRTTGRRVCMVNLPRTSCVARNLEPGVKYTLGLFFFDYAGNYSKRRAAYFAGTTVTATARPSTVASGSVVRIKGSLYHGRPAANTILSSKPVELQSRVRVGGSWGRWGNVATAVTTSGPSSWGDYAFGRKVTRTAQFRVKYAGDSFHTGDFSPARTVTVG